MNFGIDELESRVNFCLWEIHDNGVLIHPRLHGLFIGTRTSVDINFRCVVRLKIS